MSANKVNIIFFLALQLLGAGSLHGQEAAPQKLSKIVILGDSLTEGYGVAKADAFPALLEKKMREENYPELEIINSGIGGSTTASALSRLKWVLKSKPQIVILALGGNDGLRGTDLKATEKNLASAIQYSQKKGIRVILAGMQIPPNYGKEYTENFKKIFPRLAQKYKVDLIPFLLKGVGGESDLNLPDGIHPNEEGHQVIAETLHKFLKEKL